MNSKSLSKIKTVFKSINDKLAFLQDPQTFKRGKSLTPEKIQKNIDALEADQSSFEKDQRKINNSVEKRLNYLEQAIEESSQPISPERIVADTPRINDARPVEETEESLKNVNLKYNPDAKRYQETTGKMQFVGRDEVTNRLKQNQSTIGAAPEEEKTILKSINDNLFQANISLKNIVKSLTGDQAPTTQSSNKKDAVAVDDKGNRIAKDDEGGGGGILASIGLLLFAFLPALIKMAKEFIANLQEKLRTLLVPVFDFILEDVKPFFTETIPNLFLETLPNFFEEKFTVVKSYLEDFMDNVSIFISTIKKGVGEALVNLGDLLPGKAGNSVKDAGQKMIDSAGTDITDAKERKAGRQEARDKQEKINTLKDQVEDEAKKFLERHKGEGYTGYKINTDEKKQYVTVTYTGNTERMESFDINKSLDKGVLIKRELGSKDETITDSKPSSKDGTDATPIQSNTSAPVTTSDATPAGSSESLGSTISSGGSTAGDGTSAGGAPFPEIPQAQIQNPETATSGDQISQGTKEATDPTIGRSQTNQGSNVIQLNTGSKGFNLKEGKPHDINDVPDPTPLLGSLADQLFYLRA